MTVRLFVSSLFLSALMVSCTEPEEAAVPQGIITYDVSFPFNTDDLLQYIYPEEMEVAFRGDQITGKLEAMGGIVSNQFIVNNRQRVFDQYLKTNKGKFHITLDSAGVEQMLLDSPEMRLIPTDSTTTIAGYTCKLTIADFVIDSVPAIELWHTAEIPVDNPNWCNQYHDLDEYLLGYDIEHFGMRMRVRANSVNMTEVDDSRFALQPEFTDLDYPGMRNVISELLDVLSETH